LAGLEYLSLTLLGAVFVVGALFYGWQQYQWIHYGYRIEEAQRRIEDLSEVGRQLRVEHATLASPQRIDEKARLDLGMVTPRSDQVVSVDAGFVMARAAADLVDIEGIQLAERAD
jgi:cell division protein FtsL